MSSNELIHYGILGMKWGVRRYQNKDGTLTPAGEKRAKNRSGSMSDDELTSNIRRLALEKQYNTLSKEAAKPSKLEKTKKVVDAGSTLTNQLKNLNRESINSTRTKEKLDLSKMSDKELRDRINRTNLERQYNDLFGKDEVYISKGREHLTKILEVGGGVLTVGSSALAIALAIKELKR